MRVELVNGMWLLNLKGDKKVKVEKGQVIEVKEHERLKGVYAYTVEGEDYLIDEFFLPEL